MAFWLGFRDTVGQIDSGSSKGGGRTSDSRPRGPSGETCNDELLVMTCVVSGDIIGDACTELEVVTDDADMGTDGAEAIEGRKSVRTRDMARRLAEEVLRCDRGGCEGVCGEYCCCGECLEVGGKLGLGEEDMFFKANPLPSS
jgi:hypothetical protein